MDNFNPLNAELNPICHLLAILGARHIFHVSGLTVKELKELPENHFQHCFTARHSFPNACVCMFVCVCVCVFEDEYFEGNVAARRS
jgi:hypothetical protein